MKTPQPVSTGLPRTLRTAADSHGREKDSGAYALLKKSGKFALSFPKAARKDLAFAFFGPTTVEGNHINGHEFERGAISSAPVLSSTPAFIEGTYVGVVDMGDHPCVVGQVADAVLKRDYQILTLKEWCELRRVSEVQHIRRVSSQTIWQFNPNDLQADPLVVAVDTPCDLGVVSPPENP